ncbi:HXXXD-type acyl-transferase family protein [Arachis hypogaea]|nr:HXXXD-type acyl-transferase family protein [Arachis hypogaea]
MTKNLKETLSEMLNYYPMVTGRLVRDSEEKWKVKCNDAGVRVVEAKAKECGGMVEECG